MSDGSTDMTLVRPGDSGYDELRRVWNAMIDRRPAAIARCTGTADVVAALSLARDAGLPVSVHGGGHSVAGHAVCDGGVMIDLRLMKGIEVDANARTCRAQAGLTWGELDAATQVHGLAVTGGRMSTTGIAGLTLGGGSGWLERKCGYTADNLLSVEIVTAEGQVLTASKSENPHLFWGVRGGGGNFGVVTRFQFRLHPIGPIVLAGMLLYPASMAAEVLQGFRGVMTGAPDALGAALVLSTAPPEDFVPEPLRGQPVAGVAVCWAGPLDEGDKALRPLRELVPPAADTVEPMPYTAVQQLIDAGSPEGLRNYFASDYLSALPDEAFEVMCRYHLSRPSPMTEIVALPGGGAIGRAPGDKLGFEQRKAPFNYVIHSKWSETSDDEPNVAWTRELRDALEPFTTGGVYLNFIGDEGDARIVAAYGPEAYSRLQALKDRYDPSNLFRLNQNVKPSAAMAGIAATG
jgi:FAD/FMN-containing dehydrogenase